MEKTKEQFLRYINYFLCILTMSVITFNNIDRKYNNRIKRSRATDSLFMTPIQGISKNLNYLSHLA